MRKLVRYVFKDAGSYFKEKYGLDSVEDVNPLHLRRPGERYFRSANDIEEWVINEQEKYLEMAREVFGPLLGR